MKQAAGHEPLAQFPCEGARDTADENVANLLAPEPRHAAVRGISGANRVLADAGGAFVAVGAESPGEQGRQGRSHSQAASARSRGGRAEANGE